MKFKSAIILLTAVSSCAHGATVIESWQFNEAANTQFSGLTNSAGTGAWSGNTANAKTNGSGQFVFSQGTGTQPDNIFRNSTLTTIDVSTGVYELAWYYSSASIAGGDTGGANVGFGIRDTATNTDLFTVRLHRISSELRLQQNNADVYDFNSTTVGDLAIRVRFDLDANTANMYYKIGSDPEQAASQLTFSSTLEMDAVRLLANTNSTDWGAADTVSIDYLTLTAIPEPAAALLGGLGLLALLRRRR